MPKPRKSSPESQLINNLVDMVLSMVKTIGEILYLAWKASQVTIGRKKLFIWATGLFFGLLVIRGLMYTLLTSSVVDGSRLNPNLVPFDELISLYLLLFAPYLAFRTVAAIPRLWPGLKYATIWMDRLVFGGLCAAYLLWPFASALKVPPQERKIHKTVQSYTYSRAGYYLYQMATPLGVKHFAVEGPRGTPRDKRSVNLIKFYLDTTWKWILLTFLFWAFIFKDRITRIFGGAEGLGSEDTAMPKDAFLLTPVEPSKPIEIARRGPALEIDQLNRHTLIIGTTGSGKTSFMRYLAKELLRRGHGLLYIDPKSDPGVAHSLWKYSKALNRERDFIWFDLSEPERSATYNPLLRSECSVLVNAIMASKEWSEEYFKSRAFTALLVLFESLQKLGLAVAFQDVYELLTLKAVLPALARKVNDPKLARDLTNIARWEPKDLAGLTAYLLNLDRSFPQTRTTSPSLDFLDAYRLKKIVYVGLSVNAYKDTAKMFGRLLFNDLRTVTSLVERDKGSISPFAVFIDEAGSLLPQDSIHWLNQCRSAGFLALLGIQSTADLERISPEFRKQVFTNCNSLIAFRPNDYATAEEIARTIGTKQVTVETRAYGEPDMFFGAPRVGTSEREAEAFIIHPQRIKELRDGEAAVLVRGKDIESGIRWIYRLPPDGLNSFADLPPSPKEPAVSFPRLSIQDLLSAKAGTSGDGRPPEDQGGGSIDGNGGPPPFPPQKPSVIRKPKLDLET